MPPSYFSRYLNGEYEQVWQELLGLGPNIQQSALFEDALAVARETMRRARDNIETICLRLLDGGYSFYFPFFRPADKKDLECIQQIEAITGGPLPLSLRAWYEFVGEVCLIGYTKDSSNYIVTDLDELLNIPTLNQILNPPNTFSDPLQIFSPRGTLEDLNNHRMDFEQGYIESYDYDFIISGTAASKASREDQKRIVIRLPNSAMDAQVIGTWDWGSLTFVEYLREHFRWGGFPGLANASKPPIEILELLKMDLLPI